MAFGPALENSFYYDIDSPTPIREEDFPRIEEEMRKIVADAEPFERFERSTDEARELVRDLGQGYKVEHIDDNLKQYPTLSFYRQGEFIDLCRGPHIPNAGKVGAFKLLGIAGAYWKNDASRKQLQRLSGTAFFNQKDLDAYLHQLEEAKKRDHRLLGKQLKLFTISPAVGGGLILWMPKGATVRGILESFIKEELLKRGYQPVYTPHIGRLELYRTSGHFPYYRDAQYPPLFFHPLGQAVDTWLNLFEAKQLTASAEKALLALADEYLKATAAAESNEQRHQALLLRTMWVNYQNAESSEEKAKALREWLHGQEGYLVKPMNCPHHIQIYKAEPHSYRDLPVRLAEFGTVYRFEQTGELSGLTRVRGFTQDDAHLFITPEQTEAELSANLDLVLFVLSSLGLNDYRVRVALRDPGSDKFVGKAENWEKAEKTLLELVQSRGMNYSAEKGEGAFYGPKIDFVVRDCIGREFQLGTVQLDYTLPERFDLEYIGKDNKPHRPVMIHRRSVRLDGALHRHPHRAFRRRLSAVAGAEQARVMPVSERFADYGRRIENELRGHGFRVSGDYRPEKIGYKIREAQLEKIPYMLIVGEKEQTAGNVSVRDRVDGDLGAMSVTEFVHRLAEEVRERRIRQVSTASAGLADRGAQFAD